MYQVQVFMLLQCTDLYTETYRLEVGEGGKMQYVIFILKIA